jgi:hypothetical protein
VAEELGLDRPTGRVLAVDWVPTQLDRPEALVLIYDGGVLAAADAAAITVPPSELAGFAFVPPERVAGLVRPVIGRRIAAGLDALAAGTVASLEDGAAAG